MHASLLLILLLFMHFLSHLFCLFVCFTYSFHLFLEEKKADPENGDTGRVTYSKHVCTFALKSFDILCLSECVPWSWITMLIYFCDFKVHIRKSKLRKDFPKCSSFVFLRDPILREKWEENQLKKALIYFKTYFLLPSPGIETAHLFPLCSKFLTSKISLFL